MGYPSREAELQMLAHHEAGFNPESTAVALAQPVLSAAEAIALRSLPDTVRVAPEVLEYITSITRATREENSLSLGASPRATVALMRAARAAAVMEGRSFVTPDDVKDRVYSALRHRVTLSPELEVEGRSADDALSAILLRITAPK
jgi:MoxR-like ATPase